MSAAPKSSVSAADTSDLSFDIIVVGGGASGLAAAIEAASLGRKVVLVEKGASLGGTSIRSVGSVTAAGTALQRATVQGDTAQAHFEDMALFARQRGLEGKDNLQLRRVLVDQMAGTVEWLTGLGVVFFGAMPEPPHRQPRMHNVLPHSRSYIYHLEKRARQLGVDVRVSTRVLRLTQSQGRVDGVVASAAGRAEVRFGARLGVILASGDYSSSPDMKAQFVSRGIADIEGINPNSTGDGQRMVQAVGGEIVNGEVMVGPEIRFVAPTGRTLISRIPPLRPVALLIRWAMGALPSWMLRPFLMKFVTTNLAPSHNLFAKGAILVNRNGQRFVDERKSPEQSIAAQPERIAFVLMDDAIARQFEAWPNFISTAPGVAYAYLADYRRNRRDITFSGQTLAELAARIGVPPKALEQSVSAYNATRAPGTPALSQGPFHAIGPAKSWIVLTDGGARIDSSFRVLHAQGDPIRGLFAAGSAGQGGVLLEGHGHHLGWAFASGRLAGRSAAASAASAASAPSVPSAPASLAQAAEPIQRTS